MYVDIHAKNKKRKPEHVLETFYGQLQHLFVVKFKPQARDELGLEDDEPLTIFLAAIKNCVLDKPATIQALDIHFYSKLGPLHVIDVTSLQCVVGRVRDGTRWGIIDRSGALARAVAM